LAVLVVLAALLAVVLVVLVMLAAVSITAAGVTAFLCGYLKKTCEMRNG
jgi:hypothetical protein